jgi:hypothetical protein
VVASSALQNFQNYGKINSRLQLGVYYHKTIDDIFKWSPLTTTLKIITLSKMTLGIPENNATLSLNDPQYYDTQYDDSQYDDSQYDDTQYVVT